MITEFLMKADCLLNFLSDNLIQFKYKEIPINVYKVVQTGPKIQFGGEKKGLFKYWYQSVIAEKVKIDPIKPAN
jgi:hypothetical protein